MNLLVYGTLMVPEVMQSVTGESPVVITAILAGYRRCMVKNRVYPAVIPDASSKVEGLLVQDIDTDSLSKIDDLEGDEYLRTKVKVATNYGTAVAQVYVWKGDVGALDLDHDWDLEEFSTRHLADYTKRYLSE